ncbi:AraC-like DNA-binding protein [Rubrivivax gelatinosus]|uniref:helix-turn-helix domain-containing protein n=1 Tax=Rubrivivax gelatinosus TaxID=28068 RepID=UPI0018CA3639|nr:AraC family transcriptional regulator [Rubrivivax gelatinosus]MBG6080645.1 AraC-like DNA-binding protein [Rubrivivax gelatinosus]
MPAATTPLDRLLPGAIARHRHQGAYAALVLEGRYLEAGEGGRWQVEPGDVLVHPAFSIHADWVGRGGAQVVNLPLRSAGRLPPAFRARDPQALLDLADRGQAIELPEHADALPPLQHDWPDALAAALRADPGLPLKTWSRHAGLAPATLSRGFAAAYGVTPARYRADLRLARALERLTGPEPLVQLALALGYADQAHLSRAVRAATGMTPRQLRQSNPFKTRPDAQP